jgi:ABC-type nitrate/sulfonate/bicarbonate transport system substrate-binding protein
MSGIGSKSSISRRSAIVGSAAIMTGAAGFPSLSFAQAMPKLAGVSFSLSSISSQGATIIKKLGLDKKHGWELDVVVRNSTEAYYNDFISGGFDAWHIGGVYTMGRLASKGVPITLVAATLRYPYPMVARADSGIKSIADLKGKKIGIDRAGYMYVGLVEIAKTAGIDLEKDCQIVNMGLLQTIPRLQRGDCDASPMLFEQGLQLTQDAPNQFHIPFDCDLERARAFGAKALYQYLAIRTSWIETNKAIIPNIVASYKDMADFYRANAPEAVQILSSSKDQGGAELKPAIAGAMYLTGILGGLKTVWTAIPAAEVEEDIFKELEKYKDSNLLDKLPDRKTFVHRL